MSGWHAPHARAARPRGGAGAALALALAAGPVMREVPPGLLASALQSNVPLAVTRAGLEVEVSQPTRLVFRFQGAQELDLEYEATGILLLTSATAYPASGGLPDHRTPPQRYRRVPSGRGRLRIDMRQTPRWSPSGFPYLLLEGAGHFTITRVAYLPSPPDAASSREAFDRSMFWAPYSFDFTAINVLDPPYWSASRGTFLFDRLGVSFLLLTALLAVGSAAVRGRVRPGWALAAAALLATAAGDAVFLAKVVPSLTLSLEPDPEVRIRENYALAPKLGALAALARATVLAGDRVGVRVAGGGADWFAAEVICFNLAPRRCVTLVPGKLELTGLSQVDRLRPEELDAIVSYGSDDPLPAGFQAVSQVSPDAFVARRP